MRTVVTPMNCRYLPLILLVAACAPKELPREYILDELEISPEGIAYCEKQDAFYLTSIAKSKIVRVDSRTGEQTDFISEGAQGFGSGVGIYVDEQQQQLLAISGFYMRENTETALSRFDLNSGELVARYTIPDSGRHFLNDLIMSGKGDVYLTDTEDASVYILGAGSEKLKLFLRSKEIEYPNGIAISDDDRTLYVASYTKGIRIINIQSKAIINNPDTTTLTQGIDGLEFYKGNLYAVQNGIDKNGDNFRQMILDKSGEKITDVRIIDYNNPQLDVPLTFCIAGNRAVVIGNSNLRHFDQERFEFPSLDSLTKTKLLVYDLPDR